MKKLLSIILVVVAISFYGNESKAQVSAGSKIIDAYYGYSLASSIWKTAEADNILGSNYSGVGPVGFRFEYMVSDVIGLGVDANYRSSEYSQTYDNIGISYEDKYSVTQLRVMGRLNFHVATTERVDYYFGMGFGYKSTDRKFESTDIYAISVDFPSIPVAFRLSTGLRYFFTESVGAHFEVGVGGGSIATGGLSLKF